MYLPYDCISCMASEAYRVALAALGYLFPKNSGKERKGVTLRHGCCWETFSTHLAEYILCTCWCILMRFVYNYHKKKLDLKQINLKVRWFRVISIFNYLDLMNVSLRPYTSQSPTDYHGAALALNETKENTKISLSWDLPTERHNAILRVGPPQLACSD